MRQTRLTAAVVGFAAVLALILLSRGDGSTTPSLDSGPERKAPEGESSGGESATSDDTSESLRTSRFRPPEERIVRVVDGRGRTIEKALVRLCPPHARQMRADDFVDVGTTDALGELTIPRKLTDDHARLTWTQVSKNGFAPNDADLPGAGKTVTIALSRGHAYTVRTVDSARGQPIADVMVELTGFAQFNDGPNYEYGRRTLPGVGVLKRTAVAYSDENGVATVPNLAPGSYQVRFFHPHYVPVLNAPRLTETVPADHERTVRFAELYAEIARLESRGAEVVEWSVSYPAPVSRTIGATAGRFRRVRSRVYRSLQRRFPDSIILLAPQCEDLPPLNSASAKLTVVLEHGGVHEDQIGLRPLKDLVAPRLIEIPQMRVPVQGTLRVLCRGPKGRAVRFGPFQVTSRERSRIPFYRVDVDSAVSLPPGEYEVRPFRGINRGLCRPRTVSVRGGESSQVVIPLSYDIRLCDLRFAAGIDLAGIRTQVKWKKGGKRAGSVIVTGSTLSTWLPVGEIQLEIEALGFLGSRRTVTIPASSSANAEPWVINWRMEVARSGG